MQEALEKRKKQEILRNEYRQRQALVEIKDIFLDAFSLQVPSETKPIMEQLSIIVDEVQNKDFDTNVGELSYYRDSYQVVLN